MRGRWSNRAGVKRSRLLAIVVVGGIAALGYYGWHDHVQSKAHALLADAMTVQDAAGRAAAGARHAGQRHLFPDRARASAGRAHQVQDRRGRVSLDRCRHLRALSGRRRIARARHAAGRDRRVSAGDRQGRQRLLRPDGAARSRRSAGAPRGSSIRRSTRSRISRSARTARCRSTAS